METLNKFKGVLVTLVAIMSALTYFYGFLKLDTEPFKDTDIAVVQTNGLLFIQWELADIPETPTQIIYYIDGVQFANEEYPEGLKAARGISNKWISSYVLPPYAYVTPGEHDFKAVVSFNGWSTLFTPKTVTFSTVFDVEDRINENQSNYNVSPNSRPSYWV